MVKDSEIFSRLNSVYFKIIHSDMDHLPSFSVSAGQKIET